MEKIKTKASLSSALNYLFKTQLFDLIKTVLIAKLINIKTARMMSS